MNTLQKVKSQYEQSSLFYIGNIWSVISATEPNVMHTWGTS